jgi:acyl dehydratase
MTASPTVAQRFFEDVAVGDEIAAQDYGPLTIEHTVRWAAMQENWARLHFDRQYVQQHSGLRTFIASGAYRQALLTRAITDWIGPRGWLHRLTVRQTAPTFEGDSMRFGGRVAEKSASADDPWLRCELEVTNQDGQTVITGQCTVTLPRKG